MAGGAAAVDYGRVAEVFLATWGPAPRTEARVAASGRRQDHYEVLGVNPDAPDEVIRAAYRALAAKYHPDRNPSDGDAELKLKRLNAAFRVLGDPERRKQYDELTQSPEASDKAPSEPASEPAKETPPRGNAPGERTREEPPPRKPSTHAVGPNKRRILAIILKTAGYLFLAFVTIVGGLFLYVENQENESRAEQAAVTVEAQYEPTACPQERPVGLVITNKSKRTLKSLSFSLQAFENGRSDNLAIDSDDLESHVIVLPGAISKTCWKSPSLKRNVSVFFRAEKSFPGATFYDANEFIPQTESPRDSDGATAAATKWVWITQPDYRIAFPDTPQPAQRHTETTRLGPVTITYTTLDRHDTVYWVMERDYPDGSMLDEQTFMDEAFKPIRAEVHERTMIGNCKGRSFSVVPVKGAIVRGLFCVNGAHGYEASVATNDPPSADQAREAASFLGSFAVLSSVVGAKAGLTKPTAPPKTAADGGDCGCNGDLVCMMKCGW